MIVLKKNSKKIFSINFFKFFKFSLENYMKNCKNICIATLISNKTLYLTLLIIIIMGKIIFY